MFKCLVETIENMIEDGKEKEYEVYCKENMFLGYNRYLFTKKQLLQYMREHEVCTIQVFKIKDRVKINKTFEIEED